MLLAGGQGTRLLALTKKNAKPAVPFGGKYKIIDFPLSNCINSNIDTIGVLTQYQPFDLNQYIGNGQPWDLDRLNGGVFVLPPYITSKKGEWYKGTANAIYQNIAFIEKFQPENVLILSGDHIYKMDYHAMLLEHQKKKADCTIAVLNVPIEEASRFGIMNTDKNNKITEFEEKPAKPKSNKASMGIYIFKWDKLKKYLIEDEENPNSQNDFGKNIIPTMLAEDQKMYAYDFEGYWKDVGTIASLWEANMDFLNGEIGNQPCEKEKPWKIYSRNMAYPPHYISAKGKVINSLITEGCSINGLVKDSVISSSVTVEEGATVYKAVIMPGAVIKKGAKVEYTIVGENAVVGENAKVGNNQDEKQSNWNIAVIGPNFELEKGTKVGANEVLEKKEI